MDELQEKFDKSKAELKEKLEKHFRKRTFANSMSIVSITAALVPLFFLTVKFFGGDFTFEDSSQLKVEKLIQEIRSKNELLKRRTDSIFQENEQMKSLLDSAAFKPSQEQIKFLDLQNKVNSQEIQIAKLNSVILENPEKAVAIPMLKQKMDNWDKQYDKDTKSIKDEIARVYDMNKWIIGLVFTMLVSLVALNISNLYTKSKKE